MRRRHTQNLTPLPPAQLGAHNAVDTRADGVPGLVDQNAGVVVEPHDAAVRPLHALPRPHHDRVPDVSSLHFVRGCRGAHACVACAALLLDYRYEAVACLFFGRFG